MGSNGTSSHDSSMEQEGLSSHATYKRIRVEIIGITCSIVGVTSAFLTSFDSIVIFDFSLAEIGGSIAPISVLGLLLSCYALCTSSNGRKIAWYGLFFGAVGILCLSSIYALLIDYMFRH